MNKKLVIMASFAIDLASLSKCTQRGVAAIITNKDMDQVYSIGINGGPKGGIQCLCTTLGKYGCVHAEAQAIAKSTTTDKEKIMVCTLSPCITCATLIINSGFIAVYYVERWKDTSGLSLLAGADIKAEKVSFSDWRNDCFG